MRAKHLRMWHHAENQEENPDLGNWEKVVAIIQAALRVGELTVSCAWQTLVMTPKGGGTDFRGVVLMEVLWKAISGIINLWLSYSVQFHDALHGFSAGREMGTATMKEKLLQQLNVMMETVFHAIFLNLSKA